MIKPILLAALFLSPVPVFAADLAMPATDAPAMAPPASTSWDGPYIGASLGYSWATADDTSSLNHDMNPAGPSVGVQAGYLFSLSDNIVAGIEGSVDWARESASISPFINPGSITQTINWDGALVGKLGVNLDNFLPYIDAGVAFANADRNDTYTGADPSNTQVGWTAGVGVEAMLADHLSGFVSYSYSDYGTATYNTQGGGVSPTVHLTDSAVKVGLNYHF